MKPKLISYGRLVNKGNYEHVRIELQVEIEESEKVADVYKKIKDFVDKKCEIETIDSSKIEKAKEILNNKLNYRLREIEEAERILQKIELDENIF
ncbi:hypothetical protein [Rosettibacter firmus]|uniref:hypothetical protein n=1 Tax=Rosettibacter firmus TaxID=3111522 RepID=UPI00316E4E35